MGRRLELVGWLGLAGAAGFAIVCAQLALLAERVAELERPLATLARSVEPQTTTTTWETRDGEIALLTTRRGDETLREWIERHAVAVEEAQAVAPDVRASK